MNYTGKIISLAYPDTFVKHSDESSTGVFLALGLGKDNYVKAGHAAFVLIENSTGIAEYYDFGRYITPEGKGRVRSAVTDVELEIPFRAEFTSDYGLKNIEEFLLWLEANPEKTHGDGRLVASVCDAIYYDKAREFVLKIQSKGSIPYKAFGKEGCNCSRIVTDTILAGTDSKKIKLPLLRNKLFTPSPLGNVEKASLDNPIYEVYKGEVQQYPGSAFRENLVNYFDKNIPKSKENKNFLDSSVFSGKAHFLSGTGSSAYFVLNKTEIDDLFLIIRYTIFGKEDFRGLFEVKNEIFDIEKDFLFTYDSNCKYCHVEQGGLCIRFELVKRVRV